MFFKAMPDANAESVILEMIFIFLQEQTFPMQPVNMKFMTS